MTLGFDSGFCTCKAGAILLESQLLSIFSCHFGDGDLELFPWASLEP
jgi:hypothetical protein